MVMKSKTMYFYVLLKYLILGIEQKLISTNMHFIRSYDNIEI